MDQKSSKQFNNKVVKDLKARKDFKPGDLLTKAQATNKRPTKRTVAVLGLI